LGNDEVYYACWKSNPNITEWMKARNMSEYNQLELYYSERLLDIVKRLDKKATVWQDVYDNHVPVGLLQKLIFLIQKLIFALIF